MKEILKVEFEFKLHLQKKDLCCAWEKPKYIVIFSNICTNEIKEARNFYFESDICNIFMSNIWDVQF